MRTQSAAPSAKVWAATLAALLTPILLGLLAKAFPAVPLPVDANDLVQQLVQGALHLISPDSPLAQEPGWLHKN